LWTDTNHAGNPQITRIFAGLREYTAEKAASTVQTADFSRIIVRLPYGTGILNKPGIIP
jgi:hypothetical protein